MKRIFFLALFSLVRVHAGMIEIGDGVNNNAYPFSANYHGTYQQIIWSVVLPAESFQINGIGFRTIGGDFTVNLPPDPYWDLVVKVGDVSPNFLSAQYSDNPAVFEALNGRITPNIVGDGSIDLIIPFSTPFNHTGGSNLLIQIVNEGTNTQWTSLRANTPYNYGARTYSAIDQPIGIPDGVTLDTVLFTSSAATPEPATWLLVSAGILGAVMFRRRTGTA